MDTPSKLHSSFKLNNRQQSYESRSTLVDQTSYLSQFSFQGKMDALLRFTNQSSLEHFRREFDSASDQFQIIHQYHHIPLVHAALTSNEINELMIRNDIESIYGNPCIYLCLDTIAHTFELPKIQATLLKFTGKDITIGLIDSGIDQSHPDLNGKVIRSINCVDNEQGDSTGHGTYLAGILTGSGKMSQNLYQGIVPEASLIDIKIFGKDGASSMAILLYGLDQILTYSTDTLPQILLFGCTSAPLEEEYSPLSEYCNLLSGRNVLICAPMGNFGPEPRTIGYPAAIPGILTVGGLDDTNRVCFFSSRGELPEIAKIEEKTADHHPDENPKSIEEKPNLYLPATNIIAPRAQSLNYGVQIFDNPYYSSISGTSCAAAVASGICAILRQAFPALISREIVELIQKSGNIPINTISYKQYRIPDIYTILRDHNLLIPPILSFGSQLKTAGLISMGFILFMLLLLFWLL